MCRFSSLLFSSNTHSSSLSCYYYLLLLPLDAVPRPSVEIRKDNSASKRRKVSPTNAIIPSNAIPSNNTTSTVNHEQVVHQCIVATNALLAETKTVQETEEAVATLREYADLHLKDVAFLQVLQDSHILGNFREIFQSMLNSESYPILNQNHHMLLFSMCHICQNITVKVDADMIAQAKHLVEAMNAQVMDLADTMISWIRKDVDAPPQVPVNFTIRTRRESMVDILANLAMQNEMHGKDLQNRQDLKKSLYVSCRVVECAQQSGHMDVCWIVSERLFLLDVLTPLFCFFWLHSISILKNEIGTALGDKTSHLIKNLYFFQPATDFMQVRDYAIPVMKHLIISGKQQPFDAIKMICANRTASQLQVLDDDDLNQLAAKLKLIVHIQNEQHAACGRIVDFFGVLSYIDSERVASFGLFPFLASVLRRASEETRMQALWLIDNILVGDEHDGKTNSNKIRLFPGQHETHKDLWQEITNLANSGTSWKVQKQALFAVCNGIWNSCGPNHMQELLEDQVCDALVVALKANNSVGLPKAALRAFAKLLQLDGKECFGFHMRFSEHKVDGIFAQLVDDDNEDVGKMALLVAEYWNGADQYQTEEAENARTVQHVKSPYRVHTSKRARTRTANPATTLGVRQNHHAMV